MAGAIGVEVKGSSQDGPACVSPDAGRATDTSPTERADNGSLGPRASAREHRRDLSEGRPESRRQLPGQ